jgi:hypothetical protein
MHPICLLAGGLKQGGIASEFQIPAGNKLGALYHML